MMMMMISKDRLNTWKYTTTFVVIIIVVIVIIIIIIVVVVIVVVVITIVIVVVVVIVVVIIIIIIVGDKIRIFRITDLAVALAGGCTRKYLLIFIRQNTHLSVFHFYSQFSNEINSSIFLFSNLNLKNHQQGREVRL